LSSQQAFKTFPLTETKFQKDQQQSTMCY